MDQADDVSNATCTRGDEAASASISADIPGGDRIKLGDALKAAFQRMGGEDIEVDIVTAADRLAAFKSERRALKVKLCNGEITDLEHKNGLRLIEDRENNHIQGDTAAALLIAYEAERRALTVKRDNGEITDLKHMDGLGAIEERESADLVEFSKDDLLNRELNIAARGKKILFEGRKTYHLGNFAPSEDVGVPELIDPRYYNEDRNFDAEFDRIFVYHFIGVSHYHV